MNSCSSSSSSSSSSRERASDLMERFEDEFGKLYDLVLQAKGGDPLSLPFAPFARIKVPLSLGHLDQLRAFIDALRHFVDEDARSACSSTSVSLQGPCLALIELAVQLKIELKDLGILSNQGIEELAHQEGRIQVLEGLAEKSKHLGQVMETLLTQIDHIEASLAEEIGKNVSRTDENTANIKELQKAIIEIKHVLTERTDDRARLRSMLGSLTQRLDAVEGIAPNVMDEFASLRRMLHDELGLIWERLDQHNDSIEKLHVQGKNHEKLLTEMERRGPSLSSIVPQSSFSAQIMQQGKNKTCFTGRKELMGQIEASLCIAENPSSSSLALSPFPLFVVLCGGGGFGKTTAVKEHAKRHAAKYQHVFWINAETEADVQASIKGILVQQLGLEEVVSETDPAKLQRQLIKMLGLLPSWLLILDNADKPAVITGSLLPAVLACRYPPDSSSSSSSFSPFHHVLITSRVDALDWSSVNGITQCVPVCKLSLEESMLLLYRLAMIKTPGWRDSEAEARLSAFLQEDPSSLTNHADTRANQQALEWICGRSCLDGLPLALQQVGIWLSTLRDPFKFRRCKEALQSATLKLFGSENHIGSLMSSSTERARDSVLTTFSLSVSMLQDDFGLCCREVLYLCALLNPDSISPGFLLEAIRALEGESALSKHLATLPNEGDALIELSRMTSQLASLSLVQFNEDGQSLSMHRLVQQVIRLQLLSEDQAMFGRLLACCMGTVESKLDFLLELYDTSYVNAVLQSKPFLDHCHALLSLDRPIILSLLNESCAIAGSRVKILDLMASFCNNYEKQFLFQSALDVVERIGTIWYSKDCTAPRDAFVEYGRFMRMEGSLLFSLNRPRDALLCLEECVGLYHDEQDDESLNFYSNALHLLGAVYDSLQQFDKAIEHYKRALATREKVLGPDHPDVATLLNDIGIFYDNQGKYDLALKHHKRALAIREKVHGSEHPYVAASLSSIGNLCSKQGKYDLALEHYKRALAIMEKAHGPEHPDVAISLIGMGNVYSDQGKHDLALEHYKRALAIREKVHGPEHPDVATSLNNIGAVYSDQGKHDLALEHYKRALAIMENVLGPEHPLVATSLNNIGSVYSNQGKHDLALEHYKRAYSIIRLTFPDEHPKVQKILNILERAKLLVSPRRDFVPGSLSILIFGVSFLTSSLILHSKR